MVLNVYVVAVFVVKAGVVVGVVAVVMKKKWSTAHKFKLTCQVQPAPHPVMFPDSYW